MALVEAPITHFIRLKDRGGAKTITLSFKSNGFVSLTADQLSDQLLATFAPLTYCKVVAYGYTSQSLETDDSVSALNGEEANRAEISVALVRETPPTPGQTKRGVISIPGAKDELFLEAFGPLYDVIDPANALLQNFLALYVEGLILPSFTLSDYQSIQDPTVSGNVRGKRIGRGTRS